MKGFRNFLSSQMEEYLQNVDFENIHTPDDIIDNIDPDEMSDSISKKI